MTSDATMKKRGEVVLACPGNEDLARLLVGDAHELVEVEVRIRVIL